jgi:hypothetical protein
MKKILTILLTSILLFSTPISGYIYAQEEEETTVTTQEENLEEDTMEETETLAESLEEKEDTDTGISFWTILFAILGASLFIGVAYYILKNFNL